MLNKSNTKWLSVGITCIPRMAFPDGFGFISEAQICGDKGCAMAVGDSRSLRTLFKAIQSDNECQYMHLSTKSNYDDCSNALFTINKASFSGTRCLQLINQGGQSCFLSMQAIDDMLKRELIILAAMSATAKSAEQCESTFMSLLRDARTNYNSAIEKMMNNEDTIAMDIFANFTEMFHLCLNIESTKTHIEEIVENDNEAQTSSVSPK